MCRATNVVYRLDTESARSFPDSSSRAPVTDERMESVNVFPVEIGEGRVDVKIGVWAGDEENDLVFDRVSAVPRSEVWD